MKSKKSIVVVCILAVMLTVSAFVTTEMVTPKKADALTGNLVVDTGIATATCSLYVVNMSGNTRNRAFTDCMNWNLRQYK